MENEAFIYSDLKVIFAMLADVSTSFSSSSSSIVSLKCNIAKKTLVTTKPAH